ncbi:hypothetical protein JCM10449v2_005900 [Rhodotorula kratochvilovae]
MQAVWWGDVGALHDGNQGEEQKQVRLRFVAGILRPPGVTSACFGGIVTPWPTLLTDDAFPRQRARAELDSFKAQEEDERRRLHELLDDAVDCSRMHEEDARAAAEKLAHDDVHHYEGQPDDQRLRGENILKDPKSPADAKLNALDGSEALPHGGYLRGDL